MELIATARFKKALERAVQAEAFTRKIAELVGDLGERTGGDGEASAAGGSRAAERGPCCWFYAAIEAWRADTTRTCCERVSATIRTCRPRGSTVNLEVSGKRGISFLKFRGIQPTRPTRTSRTSRSSTQVEPIWPRSYLKWYENGEIDRLDVVYTRFVSTSQQDGDG